MQLVTAFKTNPDAVDNPLGLVPDPFDLSAWQRLADTDFPVWSGNSVVVTLCVTAGRMFFCSLAGYSLARLKYWGRDAVFTGLLAILAVPPIVLLIPKFLVLNSLGIYNMYAALIVPLAVDAAGVFIMKQFFEQIPPSVEEATRIDGAGTFRIFWSVVLPMAKPALITLGILSFQGSWNELGHFLIATNDPGRSDVGCPGPRIPVPDYDGGGPADDHPDRRGVRGLPALLHPGRERRRREGVTFRPNEEGPAERAVRRAHIVSRRRYQVFSHGA